MTIISSFVIIIIPKKFWNEFSVFQNFEMSIFFNTNAFIVFDFYASQLLFVKN